MESFEQTPVRGVYRPSCCRREVSVRSAAHLPVCPGCHRRARWALITSGEPRPAPARDRRASFRSMLEVESP
ncbi:MAG: hypothetical protein ACREQ9_26815 [Candidatus Binatia bacterium]